VAYLLKAKTVEADKNRCYVMARTHAAEERVTYAVKHATIQELCFLWSAPRISAAVNQHATVEEAVFSVGPAPRLYIEILTQLELELSGFPELAVATEN
jgi:hypothetical protein